MNGLQFPEIETLIIYHLLQLHNIELNYHKLMTLKGAPKANGKDTNGILSEAQSCVLLQRSKPQTISPVAVKVLNKGLQQRSRPCYQGFRFLRD